MLNWVTAAEENNYGFYIKKSTDGQSWKEIGFVEATTEIGFENGYYFLDEFPENGNNYYQIIQQDLDGKMDYSEIKAISFESSVKEPIAFPNPVSNVLELQNVADEASVQLFPINGTLIFSGESIQRIDMSHLPEGVYVLKIQSKNTVWQYSIIKE